MFSLKSPPVAGEATKIRSPLINGAPPASGVGEPRRAAAGEVAVAAVDGGIGNEEAVRDVYVSQQDGINVELQAAVQDNCGAANSLLEEFSTVSSKWKKQWVSWMKANAAAVDSFSNKMIYECKKPLSGAEVDSRSEVKLTSEWLLKWSEVASRSMPAEARHAAFRDLHDDLLHNDLRASDKRDAAINVEAFTSKYLMGSTHDLSALTIQAHQNAHGNPLSLLRAELSKSEHILSSAESQIESLLDERSTLLGKQAIKDAEEKTNSIIATMDEVVRLVYSRFHQSRLAAVDVEEFEDMASHVAATTTESTLSAKKDLSEIRRSTDSDNKKLTEFKKKHDEDNNVHRTRFREVGDVFRAEMQKNSDEEVDCWNIIQQQLGRLEALHNDRVRAVGGWMSAVERDREREFRYNEMQSALEDRMRTLSSLSAHTAEAVTYVESIAGLSNSVQSILKKKDFPTRLLDLQKQEGSRFADVYRRYSLFSARVLFTKEQRLENVRRLARATEFQIQTAAETLDVDAPKYKAQLREMRESEEGLRITTEALTQQMEKGGPLWDEVDGFLDAVDMDVEDVPLLVQELRRDLLKGHLTAVDSAVTGEQRLLDHEKAHVRKIANACNAAKDAIVGKRTERTARHGTNTSVMSSTSGVLSSHTSTPQRVAVGGGASAVRAGRTPVQ
jgi:hypothetical protein